MDYLWRSNEDISPPNGHFMGCCIYIYMHTQIYIYIYVHIYIII